jgi:tetratricopeptide (TPR) repeat protein
MSKIGLPITSAGQVTQLEFVADGSQISAQVAKDRRSDSNANIVRITYQRVGTVMKPSPGGAGLLIEHVLPGSAAEKADLKVNDIVLSVDNQHVDTVAEFRQQIDLESGEGLKLVVQRNGVEQIVRLRPDPWPEDELRNQLDEFTIGMVQVWDAQSGEPVGRLPIPREGSAGRGGPRRFGPQRLSGNAPWAAITPDGRTVVTASTFGRRTELRPFSVATGRPIRASVEHERLLRWLGFGPQGRLLATLDTRSTVQLWDAAELTPVGPRIQPSGTVSAVTFTPDGKSLVLCERTVDGPRLSLWDTMTGQRLSPSIPVPTPAGLMQCSPDGRWLAAAAVSHSCWLLPLPNPWTGDTERMRQLVEATTGTMISNSGDIDLLDGHRWKSQLEQLPTAVSSRDRSAGSADSPWALDSVRRDALHGSGGDQALEKLADSIAKNPESGRLRLGRMEILLQSQRFEEADAEFEDLLPMVDRPNLIAWLKRQSMPGLLFSGRRGFPGTPGAPGAAPGGGSSGSIRFGVARSAPDLTSRIWCIEHVLQLDPSDASGLLQLITLRIQSAQMEQAKASFKRAVQNDARNMILECLTSMASSYNSLPPSEFLQRLTEGRNEERAAALADRAAAIAKTAKGYGKLLDWIIAEQPQAWEPLMIRAERSLAESRFDDAADDLTQLAAMATPQQYEQSLLSMAGRSASRLSQPLRASSRSSSGAPYTYEQLACRLPVWETVLEVFPDNVDALQQLKYTHGRLAHWEQAAHCLERLTELTPEDSWPRYQLAPVLLKLGRVEEYRKLCQGMLDQFDQSSQPRDEGHAIRVCLWHGGAVDNPQQLVERMEAIFDKERSKLFYRQTVLGIAHLRSGSPDDAVVWLEKPLKLDSSVAPSGEIRSLAALAIAYHQSGDQTKAKQVYQQATERYAAEAPQAGSDDLGASWTDWLICDLLLDEAKTRLNVAQQ